MNTTQGSRTASSIFIGRWTPKVFVLAKRQALSRQLRRQLGSVSQRILTRTLRNLESAGLIARRVTLSKAITVEYSLTKVGRTIIAPLGGMCRWASNDGRRSRIHGRNSGGVHRQAQKIFQSERSRSVSKNKGEMIWQQAKRETRNTGKGTAP
jgi:DNA-binding HxlR family transcriptional regulator